MKKLLIGILVPVVVIAGGAATLYFLLRDNSTMEYQKTDKSVETILNENLLTAFSETKDKHQIRYELSQDDFNQVLSLAYDGMDTSVKDYLKGMEIKIDGDVYHIYIYAKASILNSKIDLACKFSSDEENYYLRIESIKVGRISGLKWMATKILGNFLTDSQLNSMFSSAGIQMKADLSNDRFVYNRNDCKADLLKMVQKQMTDDSLLSSVVSSFMDMNLLSVDFTSKVQAIIDLEPLNTNDSFCHEENMLPSSSLNLEKHKEDVKKLLENGKIDLTSSHSQIVFNYLVRGYGSLSEEEKSYIDSVDLDLIGIPSAMKKTYAGYQPSAESVRQIVASGVTDGSLVSSDGLLIKEDSLNLYLQSQGLLGYSYLIDGKKDDSYIVNYVTVDNIYFDCMNKDSVETMNMVVGLNINGYETSVILENRKEASLDYGITLKNENMYFGTKEIPSDLKSELYTLIKDNLPSNEFLTFDGKGTFTIDFRGYLSDYLSIISSTTGKTLKLDTSIEGTALTDESAGLRLKGALV